VIGATHRQLRTMVAGEQFREDRYYRLAMVEIPLPGLLERKEDLPLLQKHFVDKFATQIRETDRGYYATCPAANGNLRLARQRTGVRKCDWERCDDDRREHY
jgi:sigma54-dependent transcription regulator